jgi:hypothetical protein
MQLTYFDEIGYSHPVAGSDEMRNIRELNIYSFT